MLSKMNKRYAVSIMLMGVFLYILHSCDSFDYHPYAKNISGRTGIHAVSIPEIEKQCAGKDTVCFAFITDTQGSYNEMKSGIDYVNKRSDVDFVLHGGDQSDFGLVREFEWCRDNMERLNKPYCVLLGNHDCLGTGEHTYQTIYGRPNFSFNTSFVHFTCLNTVALEYDYSNPVPDLYWIKDDAKYIAELNKSRDSITNTVIVMHAPPFNEQFNNNVADAFEYYISAYPGMNSECGTYSEEESDTIKANTRKRAFCVYGHGHCTEVADLYNDGLLYWQCANAGKRQLLIIKVWRNGYDVEVVHF